MNKSVNTSKNVENITYVNNGKIFNNELKNILKVVKLETIKGIEKEEVKNANKQTCYEKMCFDVFKTLNISNQKARATIQYFDTIFNYQTEKRNIKHAILRYFEEENGEMNEDYKALLLGFLNNLLKTIDFQLKHKKAIDNAFNEMYNALILGKEEEFYNNFHVLYGLHLEKDSLNLDKIKALLLGNGKLNSANTFKNAFNKALINSLKYQGIYSKKLVRINIFNVLRNVKIIESKDILNDVMSFNDSVVITLLDSYEIKAPKEDDYLKRVSRFKRELLNKKVVIYPSALKELYDVASINEKNFKR